MNHSTLDLPVLLSLPLLVDGITAPCGAQQEWDTSGNHIYNANSGAVGIGTVPTDFHTSILTVASKTIPSTDTPLAGT